MNKENNSDKLPFENPKSDNRCENLREILYELNTRFYIIDINSLTILEHNDPNLKDNPYKCFEILGNDNKNPERCKDCIIDEILQHKKTTTREIEHTINGKKTIRRVISKPIFNDNGKIDKIISEVYDITSFKKYFEELQDNESKYRSVISQTADNIYLMDIESHKILEANQALKNLIEYNDEELKQMTVFDFIVNSKEDIKKVIERLKLLDRIFLPHRQYRTRSGKIVDVEVSASMINYRGKKVISVISRDITQRIASEKALDEAQKKLKIANDFKSSIISNISHEMRTPLTTILGFTKILYEEISQDEYRTMIQMIENSGKRLEKTLTSLLTLSELESKDFELNLQDLRLVDLIKSATVLFEERLEGKSIYLLESINDYHISIRTDEHLIYQVLYHLIDNSIKYTEKGYIKIEADSFEENGELFAVIRVKDTGPGIPEDQFDFIFNAFQKSDTGLGKNLEGIGIGLTLVKKMVEILGGKISIESKLNVGSVFSIIFPGFNENTDY